MVTERETHVVTHENGGGAAWFVAGILIVALIVAGLLFLEWPGSGGPARDIDVRIEVPDAPAAPAAPAPADAPAANPAN